MLFKLSLLFKNCRWKFLFWQKIVAIFGPFFGPKFGHFCSKIKFSDIFFKTAYQICLKLGQKLGAIALNHQMAVLCLGKFLFWSFLPFLGQKYIACGDIYMVLGCFCSFSSRPLMFLVNFCYLNYVYGLGMINEKLSFKKNFGHLGQLNGANSEFDLSQRRETTALRACLIYLLLLPHFSKKKLPF